MLSKKLEGFLPGVPTVVHALDAHLTQPKEEDENYKTTNVCFPLPVLNRLRPTLSRQVRQIWRSSPCRYSITDATIMNP